MRTETACEERSAMPGEMCIVCKNSRVKFPGLTYHRFPVNPERRAKWLSVFQLSEAELKPHTRVCCRHFPDGDAQKDPEISLGKRFASPIKKGAPRTKRANRRQQEKDFRQTCSVSMSRSVTPATESVTPPPHPSPPLVQPPLVAFVGEQLDRDYQVHELPCDPTTSRTLHDTSAQSLEDSNLVSSALTARIEALEAENASLKSSATKQKAVHFGVDQIKRDDRLVAFYTGFSSYRIFLAFFLFLGPAVNKLRYWGAKESARTRQRAMKLLPIDQLLMTFVRLRLNLKVVDLAFRFGISPAVVSRYFTTWICFLYNHLKEINWMPSVEQVAGTLPPVFRERYPNTYAIIDGSEIFIETPSDLHIQSSTWSSYKHHNTAKFLIAVTPNGCVSFISPLYVGSISDVELTRVKGFLAQLEQKDGIAIMADRGFTVKDMLKEIGVELNIPPFMEGRKQLPAIEVQEGRHIASVRIHVERAIGRMKSFSILKQTMPILIARLSNQIVCVCAYLTNFKPVLVPPENPTSVSESELVEVDAYFDNITDTDSSGEEY